MSKPPFICMRIVNVASKRHFAPIFRQFTPCYVDRYDSRRYTL